MLIQTGPNECISPLLVTSITHGVAFLPLVLLEIKRIRAREIWKIMTPFPLLGHLSLDAVDLLSLERGML